MIEAERQTISGIKWTSLAQAAKLGSQLLGILMLARILPPSDFGLMTMATVVTGFAYLFCDMGTAAAVIQRKEVNARFLDSIFWLNIFMGLVMMVLLTAISPFVAWCFAEPRILDILWILALIFPLSCTGTVHQALLERASNFRPLAILEAFAAFAGVIIAIIGALAGWGVYSLATQALVSSAITTSGLWLLSEWRPGRMRHMAEIRGLMGFSGNLVGFNIFNYFARNIDNILIGRFLGPADLGIYAMAYRLMFWPLQNISALINRALLPVFSRLQEKHDHLGMAYIQVTKALTFVTAPLMVGVFVLRQPFVMLILGDRWKMVSDLLFWLAPVGLLQSLGSMVGGIYIATGRTDVMLKWGVFVGLLVAIAVAIGLYWGITGVVIAYFVASLVLVWPLFRVPFSLIGLKMSEFVRNISSSILLALVMGRIIYIVQTAWPAVNISPGLKFGILVITGFLAYAVLNWTFQRALINRLYKALLSE